MSADIQGRLLLATAQLLTATHPADGRRALRPALAEGGDRPLDPSRRAGASLPQAATGPIAAAICSAQRRNIRWRSRSCSTAYLLGDGPWFTASPPSTTRRSSGQFRLACKLPLAEGRPPAACRLPPLRAFRGDSEGRASSDDPQPSHAANQFFAPHATMPCQAPGRPLPMLSSSKGRTSLVIGAVAAACTGCVAAVRNSRPDPTATTRTTLAGRASVSGGFGPASRRCR